MYLEPFKESIYLGHSFLYQPSVRSSVSIGQKCRSAYCHLQSPGICPTRLSRLLFFTHLTFSSSSWKGICTRDPSLFSNTHFYHWCVRSRDQQIFHNVYNCTCYACYDLVMCRFSHFYRSLVTMTYSTDISSMMSCPLLGCESRTLRFLCFPFFLPVLTYTTQGAIYNSSKILVSP